MKRYRTNRALVAAFLGQHSEEGKASNLFFIGDTCYSYGFHYKAAKIIDGKTMLLNSTFYSSSTDRHLSLLNQASRQTIWVPNLTPHHPENLLWFKDRIEKEILRARRSKSKQRRANQLELYCAVFNQTPPAIEDEETLYWDDMARRIQTNRQRRKERTTERRRAKKNLIKVD